MAQSANEWIATVRIALEPETGAVMNFDIRDQNIARQRHGDHSVGAVRHLIFYDR